MALLIENHFHNFYNKSLVLAKSKGVSDPEDLASSVLLELYLKDFSVNDNEHAIKLLVKYTKWRIYDYYILDNRYFSSPYLTDYDSPHYDNYFYNDTYNSILSLTNNLSPKYAQSIIDKFIHDLDDNEISSFRKKSLSSVRIDRHRAYNQIRKNIK